MVKEKRKIKYITKKQARFKYKIAGTVFILAIAAIAVLYFVMSAVRGIVPEKKPDIVVTYTLGDAAFREESGAEWKRVKNGEKLDECCEVRTKERSLIDIKLQDDTFIRVNPNSFFRIDAAGIEELLLKLSEGAIYGRFKKVRKNQKIKVNTPPVTVSVRGTKLGFEVEGDESRNYCLAGEVELTSPEYPGRSIILFEHTMSTASPELPLAGPVPMIPYDIKRLETIIASIRESVAVISGIQIRFGTGESAIDESSFNELDDAAELLLKLKKRVRIEGNTDNTGNSDYNRRLSLERANAVKSYLVKKGVPEYLLSTVGNGGDKPVFDNDSAESRDMNRRVDFFVIE